MLLHLHLILVSDALLQGWQLVDGLLGRGDRCTLRLPLGKRLVSNLRRCRCTNLIFIRAWLLPEGRQRWQTLRQLGLGLDLSLCLRRLGLLLGLGLRRIALFLRDRLTARRRRGAGPGLARRIQELDYVLQHIGRVLFRLALLTGGRLLRSRARLQHCHDGRQLAGEKAHRCHGGGLCWLNDLFWLSLNLLRLLQGRLALRGLFRALVFNKLLFLLGWLWGWLGCRQFGFFLRLGGGRRQSQRLALDFHGL